MELSGRLQELQNEVNCMNDSKDFQDAESIRSGNSHITSPPGLFPEHPPFEGMLRPSFSSQRQNEEPPSIRDTSGTSGNVFAHPQSSSALYPQELNSIWKKTVEEPIHMSTAEKSVRPERDQDLRCQSGPSAKDSVIFSGGDLFPRIMGQTNNDCRFRIFILTSSLRQQPLLAGRFGSRPRYVLVHNFPRKRCNGSRKWSSVDELRSSSSVRGISMPDFEVLDARIASALNKIIHNSHIKRKISLEEQKAPKRGSFPLRWTDCLLDPFFFTHNEKPSQHQINTAERCACQGAKPTWRWSASTSQLGGVSPSAPLSAPQLQKRACHSLCCNTRQKSSPPHAPSLLNTPSEKQWFLPGTCLHQLGNE